MGNFTSADITGGGNIAGFNKDMPSLVKDILSGNVYVKVDTVKFPLGEVAGKGEIESVNGEIYRTLRNNHFFPFSSTKMEYTDNGVTQSFLALFIVLVFFKIPSQTGT